MGGSSTKPELKSHIHDKRVKHGENIEFRCEANLEDLVVKWTKDGQRLYSGGRITICQSGTNLSLTITRAEEEDEGKYTVTLSNELDSASDSAQVTVLEYDKMWRSVDWGVNVDIRHSLQDLKPRNPQVKHLRILLHGPVGSGKSSIINSINSIFLNRVKVGALAAAVAGTSFTKIYKTYEIIDRQNRALPFVFNDIMGLENDSDEGVHPDDIISAIKGHIQEGYKFNPRFPLSERDPSYNHRPTVNEKVHCLVSVIPADKITLLDVDIIEKMQNIREHASDLRIPQVVFMTCVDLACPLVKDDLRRIYSSKLVKKKMQECSNKLGVPMNCIFPVKNYHEENNLDPYMDSLILDALKNVVNFADDYVDTLETDSQPSDIDTKPSTDEESEDSRPESSQDEMDSFDRHENREFDLEWRKVKWDISSRNRMEKELREFQLLNPDLKHLRILLYGPVGAGKSSFINSINSVFQGHICAGALVAPESGISFTKKYKTHTFRNGKSGHLPFVVNDIMGLEKGNSVGAHPNDIISALNGHVKNNYQFKSTSPLSAGDANYVDSPSLSDRVHCLVSVVPLDKVTIMDDDVITKMSAIREAASEMDIPQVIVMTMADKACPVVKEDLRKMYFSKRVKQNMQECSNRLGVPMTCIFPVKNYHEETDLDQEMDCLILTALRQIVHLAHGYIDSPDD